MWHVSTPLQSTATNVPPISHHGTGSNDTGPTWRYWYWEASYLTSTFKLLPPSVKCGVNDRMNSDFSTRLPLAGLNVTASAHRQSEHKLCSQGVAYDMLSVWS